MVDEDGNDWLEFFIMMSEMADEGDEFDPDCMYIEFISGDKLVMALDMDELKEGVYKVDGNTISLTIDGHEMTGTIDGNKIIIEGGEEGEYMMLVFEKV